MSRLTANDVRGVWDGVTMTWDEHYRFDEKTYAENVERAIAAKVHGVYTTGSTGEFYALEYDEFCRMVDIQAELCGRAGMPLQIGCCSDATGKTIKLLEYAAGKKEVGAAQVNIPYWMKLTDREVLQFFKDLHHACPDMPLVHYNITRAKNYLLGEDYLKVLDNNFRDVAAVLAEVDKPVEFTICVGIRTSHGKIREAREIEDYLNVAKRRGVNGAAFFTWETLQPYLPEVKKAGYFQKFTSGLPPRP